MHQKWGSPDDMIVTRRAEDRASMAVLGADGHHLSLTDCIYRGDPRTGMWYYNSDADIFGDIHPLDLNLATDIATAVAELVTFGSRPIIYAPLGVGHHVDHQLAHAAAWQLREQGQRVVFYEDYPYVDPRYPFTPYSAENRHGLAVTLASGRTAELHPQLCPLSAENLQAKIDSVRAYSSQLQILFGGEEAMAAHVRNYALFVGQSSPAERIWVSP
jgi:LmbE family N-acetylglucosaminyl deacetylase